MRGASAVTPPHWAYFVLAGDGQRGPHTAGVGHQFRWLLCAAAASHSAHPPARLSHAHTHHRTGVRTISCYSICNSLAATPDGNILASAHQDGKVRVWNPDSGERLHQVDDLHAAPAVSVYFTGAPRRIVSS